MDVITEGIYKMRNGEEVDVVIDNVINRTYPSRNKNKREGEGDGLPGPWSAIGQYYIDDDEVNEFDLVQRLSPHGLPATATDDMGKEVVHCAGVLFVQRTGVYRMRGGEEVEVHSLDDEQNPNFPNKGCADDKKQMTWTNDGTYLTDMVTEHAFDLVEYLRPLDSDDPEIAPIEPKIEMLYKSGESPEVFDKIKYVGRAARLIPVGEVCTIEDIMEDSVRISDPSGRTFLKHPNEFDLVSRFGDPPKFEITQLGEYETRCMGNVRVNSLDESGIHRVSGYSTEAIQYTWDIHGNSSKRENYDIVKHVERNDLRVGCYFTRSGQIARVESIEATGPDETILHGYIQQPGGYKEPMAWGMDGFAGCDPQSQMLDDDDILIACDSMETISQSIEESSEEDAPEPATPVVITPNLTTNTARDLLRDAIMNDRGSNVYAGGETPMVGDTVSETLMDNEVQEYKVHSASGDGYVVTYSVVYPDSRNNQISSKLRLVRRMDSPVPYLDSLASGACEPLDIQHGGDHYKDLPIQPVEFLQKNKIPFAESCAIKYLVRHKSKGKAEDLKKAIHFCQLALDMEYGIKSNMTYDE